MICFGSLRIQILFFKRFFYLSSTFAEYGMGAQAIGHVVPSWPGSICTGGGDSPQHRH